MNCCNIFSACFPQLALPNDIFEELSGIKNAFIIEEENGFAAVSDNNIILLCVHPDHTCKGIGTRLLKAAEQHIKDNGFDKAIIGGTSSQLFIGAVSHSADFFRKNGYSLSPDIAEMKLELADFSADICPFTAPEGVTFGYYSGSKEQLLNAVAQVSKDWVQYFDSGNIFCGFFNNEVASFCIVDEDIRCLLSDGKSKVCSIGCVGTVPKFRRKGIGLKMVALAAEDMKRKDADKCFIHYTAVYNWYARLGAEPFLFLNLGFKSF